MKKTVSVIIIALIFCFSGCAKITNIETQEVFATVTDVHYTGPWVQFIPTGKAVIPISHSAKYEVTFTYEDVTLKVDDKELYDYYKNKIGTTVKCDLVTEHYDNDSVKRTLKLREEGKNG